VRYPRWIWALGAVVAVVVAGGIVALVRLSGTNSTNLEGGAIERLIPAEADKMLQQAPVGIDLAPGYDGTLTVNGVPIPPDQLRRTPALNLVEFEPGPGKEIEQLPAGQNCVVATFWRSETGPSQSTSRAWCFTVV